MTDPLHHDALDAAILAYVLDHHPAPVHQDDLARAFAADDWQGSLSALRAAGIVHSEGALCLATTAAVRMSELLG